ncbi:unnamed protein product [Caenorhabditis sp. 36 PRJEB53466]|nr:unnamed protein product [Caenorhabditis sp. 36 PRJEB53466]
MYTNWAHHFLPKCFAALSFILNPIFIYLLFSVNQTSIGSYRCLLLLFAIFNMSFSLCDTLIPMGVHIHRYAFAVFITDGPFFEVSNRYFLPYGLIVSIFYCFMHMLVWSAVSEMMVDVDREVRYYIRDSFEKDYGVSVFQVTMSVGLYREGSYSAILKTWLGVTVDSIISFYSIVLYFVLGYRIMKKLNSQDHSSTSERTIQMQRQLFKALTVQTIIPILVNYIPCFISWTTPILSISFGRSVYLSAAIAVSTFPVLDPLAIILCVPFLRHRITARKPAPESSSCPPFGCYTII